MQSIIINLLVGINEGNELVHRIDKRCGKHKKKSKHHRKHKYEEEDADAEGEDADAEGEGEAADLPLIPVLNEGVPACDPASCLNGGRCAEGGLPVCDCSDSMYIGDYCDVCDPESCQNGGVCASDGTAGCDCSGTTYIGEFCEVYVQAASGSEGMHLQVAISAEEFNEQQEHIKEWIAKYLYAQQQQAGETENQYPAPPPRPKLTHIKAEHDLN